MLDGYLYISSFGINDFIIKNYVKSKLVVVLYYLLIGILGIFLLR
jgi:hypothetical protein